MAKDPRRHDTDRVLQTCLLRSMLRLALKLTQGGYLPRRTPLMRRRQTGQIALLELQEKCHKVIS